MAEKKTNMKDSAPQNAPKLTYEQLEAYATQTTAQAKKIFQENQMLKKALYEHSLKEVEIAIRCLDHADKFSPEFIKSVVERIEEIMNPQNETKEETKED